MPMEPGNSEDVNKLRAQLAAIVAYSDDAIIGKDLNGNIHSWNKGAEKMYGYSAEEMIGKNVSILVPGERKDELPHIYEKIKRGEHVEHFETIRVNKGGKRLHVSLVVSPIKDDSGVLVGASTIARDVTDKIEAENKLKRANTEWRMTFDAISDAIFIQGVDYSILRANAAFFKMLNLQPEDVLGKKCYMVMHKMNKPWLNCPAEKTRADMQAHTEEVMDDNIGKPLLVSTSPFYDENGEFGGVVHIAKDISEFKKTEQELRDKIDKLERFQKVTVDRELKMKELKAKITQLESKAD
jgi:PAS domain S-box-containing protein